MVQRIGSSDLIQADLESNVLLVEKIVTMAPATWFLPQLADKDEIDVDEPDSALGDMDESDDGVSGEADSQPVSSIGRSSGHYRATSDTDVKLATVKEGAQSFEHFLQSAFCCRVTGDCFLIQSYDPISKRLLGSYELVTKAGTGWVCRCKKAHVCNECWHTQAATELEKNARLIACGKSDDAVICCNQAKSVFAVLGGAGNGRAVVVRAEGRVSCCRCFYC